ncbi:RNA helicase [uncultured Collinsella sp.]|uniref:DEAD/DEAH box helicase n=1 Tax=uncultured Collinsella sp. TaxID=165190 RepID=UPI0026723031|nr:DEAD/DEAH box helicase [uncultured Collinsella sp.]
MPDASKQLESQNAFDPFAHGSLGSLAPSWWEPEAADTSGNTTDEYADGQGPFDSDDAPVARTCSPGSELEPWLTSEKAYERFIDWVAARGIDLWPHQEDALFALAAGSNVILGTPTGSGKSLVALGMMFMAMASGQRAYYTAPIKALVSEKFFYLVDILGRDNVGMITGDSHINTGAPIICCTAEILANQALREGEDTDVGCVAMDEFHFFSDPDRGWAWQVPLLTLPHAQFLLMSATLGDMTAIGQTLNRTTGRDLELIADAPRPIPLSYEYVKTALEGTVELALRQGDSPLYIVHFSQDAALQSARSLASYGVASKEQREAIKEAIKGGRFTTAFGKTLKHLISSGVGLHHAGMLPRYRLLVEKLAQQGLLPVICGTDTLGVGINVPIHTVLLTGLTKFDGRKQRRLRSREFHQIAGRAGRSGFDTEGVVIAEAPEFEIENHKAELKAMGDPKKMKRLKKKKPPEGFVTWNEATFTRLIESEPEMLKPRLRITHSMVLAEVEQGGDAWARVLELIEASLQTPEEKAKLKLRAAEIFATLIDAGVVVREACGTEADADNGIGSDKTVSLTEAPKNIDALRALDATANEDDGADDNDGRPLGDTNAATGHPLDGPAAYYLTVDLPEDFALDQPLSPFLLAALELLDPESPTYTLDLISMVEATLEDPKQILRAQERRARDAAMSAMKAEGVDFEERLDRLEDVSYPKPLEDMLEVAFAKYCAQVPWANDYELSPKSVLRDMLETGCDFKSYIAQYKIARCEGILLRYLTEAYRSLDRTVPVERGTEELDDIVSWLGLVVRSVDSSLVDEWENAGAAPGAVPLKRTDEVVADRRGMTLMVRNALFQRVRLAALDKAAELGALDEDWGFGEFRWGRVLDAFYGAHEDLLTDADARSAAFLEIDDSDELSEHVWHVHQIFHDSDGDHDFGIMADVDLDATQDGDGIVFKNYRAGSFEDLAD